jgi:hypothetical protein
MEIVLNTPKHFEALDFLRQRFMAALISWLFWAIVASVRIMTFTLPYLILRDE